MTSVPPLHPTLWRTCRVIANRTRLQIFGLLLQKPGLTVCAVATRLKQPLSLTSEYLRALEARGLLAVRRIGRWVYYRPSLTTTEGPTQKLVAALRSSFQREAQPVESVFKLATAFTQPRRIEIFRALQAAPQTLGQIQLGQIQVATGIPGRTARRQLNKLEARGFVICRLGIYTVTKGPDALGRELARLALE